MTEIATSVEIAASSILHPPEKKVMVNDSASQELWNN